MQIRRVIAEERKAGGEHSQLVAAAAAAAVLVQARGDAPDPEPVADAGVLPAHFLGAHQVAEENGNLPRTTPEIWWDEK